MVDRVRDHWYWRPGWRAGRSFYTWHITFENDPILSDLHAAYQPVVSSLPGLTPVPAQWLHLTMQGVGFADKVTQEDLDPIVDAAQRRLELIPPFEIRIGPAIVDVESLQLPAQPVDRLRRLRAQLRAAITDVWGPDTVPALPELEPHISLGYWRQAADTEPLKKRVAALGGGDRQDPRHSRQLDQPQPRPPLLRVDDLRHSAPGRPQSTLTRRSSVTDKTSTALTDSSAAGVIRALLDFRSVWTTHDLVALSRVPAPTIHRVVTCLEHEDLVTRTASAIVAVPDWLPSCTAGAMTSASTRMHRHPLATHRRTGCTGRPDPDHHPAVRRHRHLRSEPMGRTTPANPLTIYTPDAHAAAEAWNLIPTSTGNVVLATPSTDVVYTRPRKTPTGLRLAAPTQVLTDLLTGASQSPAPAAPLQTWMQDHELEWRY